MSTKKQVAKIGAFEAAEMVVERLGVLGTDKFNAKLQAYGVVAIVRAIDRNTAAVRANNEITARVLKASILSDGTIGVEVES